MVETMFRALAVIALATASCSRTPPESTAPRAGADVAAKAVHTPASTSAVRQAPSGRRELQSETPKLQAAAPPDERAEKPFRFPAAERVVAVGDLHGDLASTREALRLAGAIDAEDRWIGGKLVLVQVGDQLDRGDDEPEILALLERLAKEAAAAGGAVHVLNGNHELMNAAGDLRYVTEDGLRDYSNVAVPTSATFPPAFPAAARGRLVAFAPGSELARDMSHRNTIAIVGDTLFAHAGVLAKHVSYGIGRINDDVRRFLRGETPTLPAVVAAEDAPVWTRAYGDTSPSIEACRELEQVLEALAVKRMVVGHTVQRMGVNAACDGRVYRVDVGLSDHYGHNSSQVLELRPDRVEVLTAGAPRESR